MIRTALVGSDIKLSWEVFCTFDGISDDFLLKIGSEGPCSSWNTGTTVEMAKVLSGIDKCEDFSSTWSRTGWNGDYQCEMKPKVKKSIKRLFWEIIGGCTVNFPRRVSNFKKLVTHLGAASSGV